MHELTAELLEYFKGEDFYNLAQAYRLAPLFPQSSVSGAYASMCEGVIRKVTTLENDLYHDHET